MEAGLVSFSDLWMKRVVFHLKESSLKMRSLSDSCTVEKIKLLVPMAST